MTGAYIIPTPVSAQANVSMANVKLQNSGRNGLAIESAQSLFIIG